MNMFGVGKVRDKQEDRAKRTPPKEMVENHQRVRIETAKKQSKRRADGLKTIAAVAGQLRRFEQQPAADVKYNKAGDDSRITKNLFADFRLNWNIRGKIEIFRSHEPPSKHHADDSHQHARSQKI